jgi:hypothetical protein
MKERTLPPGWKLTELLPDDPRIKEHQSYVLRIAEELALIPRKKREMPNTWQGKPIENLSQEERTAFTFSLQEKSTQAALIAQKARKPEDDIDHLLRPMPACLANTEANTLDELTNKRSLDASEIKTFAKPKSTIGQSAKSSVSADKRGNGIFAFTYSKPANLSDEQLKKLTKLGQMDATIANSPTTNEEPKESLGSTLNAWLFEKTGIWWW